MACPAGRRPRGRPRTHWCDYVTPAEDGRPGGRVRGEGSLGVPAQGNPNPRDPAPDKRTKMDGWMEICLCGLWLGACPLKKTTTI